ncbi:hypothetical protein [Streptodolium elevatio]
MIDTELGCGLQRGRATHGHAFNGTRKHVPSAVTELLPRVRHALNRAGSTWPTKDDSAPGLRIRATSQGVLIVWTGPDGFTALATERARGGDGTKAVVRAAVAGLLVQMGHTVAASADDEGLLDCEPHDQRDQLIGDGGLPGGRG